MFTERNAATRPGAGAAPNPWVTIPRPEARADVRLFCFPYAGGGAYVFREWPEGLSASAELCLINLPGRGARLKEAPFTQLAPLVETLAGVLAPYLDRPFAFFGHSMGALIGFETARELRRRGAPAPSHLFVSGRNAPHVPADTEPLHDLPEPQLIEKLRYLDGTPREVLEHAELMQLMLPILRADFAVCETYRYAAEPPLACPISAFGGLQDHDITRENLQAWAAQTAAAFTLRMLQGGHFFIHTARPLLLGVIAQELQRFARAAV
ncbi:MAG TPA: alpha/beta fold hydrolase [Pyrinomonadaceae bacterium]|nr:alpha/beta fold hydrolase [Pyrinomonadaceae bacterium]